ncbi:MAG: hypothetical protein LBJ08_00145 [Bifidobacteriaceae bacterium]|jgi:hypothetical protein|nr:hypothetical protein [Bifidobacteriaceae bacterium]
MVLSSEQEFRYARMAEQAERDGRDGRARAPGTPSTPKSRADDAAMLRGLAEHSDPAIRAAIEARTAGRPSLDATGPGGLSPRLQVRLSPAMHAELREVATQTGEAMSVIVRDAIGRYLAERVA